MLNNNYICALDIGSSKITVCVAEINRRRISNIFLESILSKGMRCGAVVDSIELVNAISKLMKNIKSRCGINIKSLYTNISGRDMLTKYSRAIIPLTEKGNKTITSSDMQKAIEQARLLGSTLEEETIHSIPASFAIDSKSNLSNPLGLYSHKLEVDLYLICAKLSTVQSLGRAINQSGFEVKDFFFSGLATARAVFNKEFNQGLNIFCDIGSDVTELLFFRDGLLRDIDILCKGGDDLTQKLQEELKVPFELAEDIKRSSGIIGDPGQIPQDRQILVKKSDLYKPIKQSQVTQIITDRAKTLCAEVKSSLEKRVSLYEINNFVIAGRAIMMEGFIEALENALGLPVKLARVTNPDITPLITGNDCLSGHKYLTYLTALGIVCEAIREGVTTALPVYQPTKNLFLKALHRFKDAYQEYF
ncbi:MAG: cell division protein FtsA [Candidatus Omnitrophica bacterium]|nr:cell division protein FtsA [Candidatus Omnitrophota bacterium]